MISTMAVIRAPRWLVRGGFYRIGAVPAMCDTYGRNEERVGRRYSVIWRRHRIPWYARGLV
jgi:hypothetical protein